MFGEYPAEMRKILGSHLPLFSKDEQKILRKAIDFIGINHYTSFYAKDCMFSSCEPGIGVTWTEGLYQRTALKEGIPIGEPVSNLCVTSSVFHLAVIRVLFNKKWLKN